MIKEWLARRRRVIEGDLTTIEERRYLSPIFYGQYRAAVPAMQRHLRGRLLDLGCGGAPFRTALAPYVATYHGVDIQARPGGAALVGDIQRLSMLRSETYDAAICMEVLEHLPDPWAAAAEMARVLRPGGMLVLSVPHLSRLHDLPHDYYRYTHAGIRTVLEGGGFEVLAVADRGGLFTFLGHQLSTVIVSAAWLLPAVRRAVWTFNRLAVTLPCYWLDRLLHTAALFPVGWVVVARKPIPEEAP